MLLSNAPRPSASVALHLTELGVEADLYDWLLTSGQATADTIAAKTIASGASGAGADARPAYFHLGPERSRPTLDACGGQEVVNRLPRVIHLRCQPFFFFFFFFFFVYKAVCNEKKHTTTKNKRKTTTWITDNICA